MEKTTMGKASKSERGSGRKIIPHFKDIRGSSLALAYQLTRRVSEAGFDWPNLRGVLRKLDEELREFRQALRNGDSKKAREELGDLLFVLVNAARFLQINPEQALRKTIQKFVTRFRYVETSLKKRGKSLKESNLTEMDQLWEESKRKGKRQAK